MTASSTTSWELELPYTAPPLSLNHRHNRWAKARLVKQLRHDAWALARQAAIGTHDHVTVTLHWRPARRGRYDDDNPYPTVKACADGITDAGVVVDDDHTHMTRRVKIHEPQPRTGGRLWLTVEATP